MTRPGFFTSADDAVADIADGASLMIGGFYAGRPEALVEALFRRGVRNLTVIANAGGMAGRLAEGRQLSRFYCSSTRGSPAFEQQYLAGEVEVEMMPQGTLAERIRAGGAGLGGFYTPSGLGTAVERGKEKRWLNGREYLLELPLTADYALIRARKADRAGNLIYWRSARNFNPIMATAARITIAEVDEVCEAGGLDPEQIVTPGIFVHRVLDLSGRVGQP